ncbi:MAG TPA: hypothetical protein V6D25_06655 [Leptolyngbyaceae cyanobacterium]
MYSVDEVIHTLNTSFSTIFCVGLLTFTSFYLYYIEAIRLGFRDKTHAIPVLGNMYFLAHDVTFLLLFNRWFNEVNHWLFRAFWVAMIVFIILEFIVHFQTLKYSRSELFPQLNQEQYIVVYLLIQLSISLIFYFLYTQVNDFLFLVHFLITNIIGIVLSLQMLISRKSRQGQSLLLALCLIVGVNVGFLGLFLPMVASYFRSLPFMLLNVGLTLINLTYIWLYLKFSSENINVTTTTVLKRN